MYLWYVRYYILCGAWWAAAGLGLVERDYYPAQGPV